VIGLLADPQLLRSSGIVLPSPIIRSASRSLRMTCSGVCLRPFITVPSSPTIIGREKLSQRSDRPQGVRPDASLERFFEQLGDEGIESFRADQLAMAAEEDDLDIVVPLIDSYASRERGLAQFAQARSRAIRILQERWDEVETLACSVIEQLRAGM
jgi:hypothetical protein